LSSVFDRERDSVTLKKEFRSEGFGFILLEKRVSEEAASDAIGLGRRGR